MRWHLRSLRHRVVSWCIRTVLKLLHNVVYFEEFARNVSWLKLRIINSEKVVCGRFPFGNIQYFAFYGRHDVMCWPIEFPKQYHFVVKGYEKEVNGNIEFGTVKKSDTMTTASRRNKAKVKAWHNDLISTLKTNFKELFYKFREYNLSIVPARLLFRMLDFPWTPYRYWEGVPQNSLHTVSWLPCISCSHLFSSLNEPLILVLLFLGLIMLRARDEQENQCLFYHAFQYKMESCFPDVWLGCMGPSGWPTAVPITYLLIKPWTWTNETVSWEMVWTQGYQLFVWRDRPWSNTINWLNTKSTGTLLNASVTAHKLPTTTDIRKLEHKLRTRTSEPMSTATCTCTLQINKQ